METNSVSTLILEQRKRLSISGVSSVDFFSDQCLKLTIGGSRAQIFGENLKVIAFAKEQGNFIAEGTFNEIKYNYKKPSILKRIFK